MRICQAREQYVRWLLVTRDLSPHTIRAYDGDIVAFERHFGTRGLVDQIDRERVVAFIEAQRACGLSSTSIRRRASGLRGFCKWLLSRSLLDGDPWVGTTVAAGRSRKLPRIVPTHELDDLFRVDRAPPGRREAGSPYIRVDLDALQRDLKMAVYTVRSGKGTVFVFDANAG